MTAQGDGDDVGGGDGEHHQFERALAIDDKLFEPRAVEEDDKDDGPTNADEEPVAARHVRNCEATLRFLRVCPGLPCEHEVHRVFGQDGDDGDDGEGQALGDIELCGFGRKAEEEGRGQNGNTEYRCGDDGRGMDSPEAQDDAGQADEAEPEDSEPEDAVGAALHMKCAHDAACPGNDGVSCLMEPLAERPQRTRPGSRYQPPA